MRKVSILTIVLWFLSQVSYAFQLESRKVGTGPCSQEYVNQVLKARWAVFSEEKTVRLGWGIFHGVDYVPQQMVVSQPVAVQLAGGLQGNIAQLIERIEQEQEVKDMGLSPALSKQLGFNEGEVQYPVRYLRTGDKREGFMYTKDRKDIIVFHNTDRDGEGYFYRATSNGVLLSVVHVQVMPDRSRRYSAKSLPDEELERNFRSHLGFWLGRYGIGL